MEASDPVENKRVPYGLGVWRACSKACWEIRMIIRFFCVLPYILLRTHKYPLVEIFMAGETPIKGGECFMGRRMDAPDTGVT